ncbi:MAG TPA: hypothetical protein VKT82_26825 [Ktedonobacterales bacterium]|nr:hypothetical protein [Ktedonobacterales bacterium]
MALIGGPLPPRPFSSGRYVHSDPLRREFGLRLLAEPLPEPLRSRLIRAWRRPARYDGRQAIQSVHRQRPDAASFSLLSIRVLGLLAFTELEASRRVVETPRAEISRETRNTLLKAQGAYLRLLYAALAARMGEAGALAEFERLVQNVV